MYETMRISENNRDIVETLEIFATDPAYVIPPEAQVLIAEVQAKTRRQSNSQLKKSPVVKPQQSPKLPPQR
jgi:hypothetical protein